MLPTDLKSFLQKFSFSPVIHLPAKYDIYDFSKGYDENRYRESKYGIGKYLEKRSGMYEQALFAGNRNIHVGIDIAAPEGDAVHAFYEGEIFLFQDNAQDGDYGPTIITKHILGDLVIYALHGHLSRESLIGKKPGQKISKGEAFASIGSKAINGGWNPHLHFQLCLQEPQIADLPGAVSEQDLPNALKLYPDPRYVLGPLY